MDLRMSVNQICDWICGLGILGLFEVLYLFNTELRLSILHPFFYFAFTSPPMRKRKRETEIMSIKQCFCLGQEQSKISRLPLLVQYFFSIYCDGEEWQKCCEERATAVLTWAVAGSFPNKDAQCEPY